MAKNRPSFGKQVSKGIRDTYSKSNVQELPAAPAEEKPEKSEKKEVKPKVQAPAPETRPNSLPGVNPYYDYHPATGARGGRLGAPRKSTIRTQFSLGCTKEDKLLYQRAAEAEGRTLPDFINRAVKEYIRLHGLDE